MSRLSESGPKNPVEHPGEPSSNAIREIIAQYEPRSLRTYTPTQAVLARGAGIYLWTAEGRRLYDFTSGVLVANLGHGNRLWDTAFYRHLMSGPSYEPTGELFCEVHPLSAYNAITQVEAEASQRLVSLLQERPGGRRLRQVMWAASGSEAIQKALWAALARDRTRDMIVATRYGFHGKKGLAGATSGCETDPERDPRVRFISFPMEESRDVSLRDKPFDPSPYQRELVKLKNEFGSRLSLIITEPYLGGSGSYHPPRDYLQLLESFCRANDMVLILDEIQSNFGRTRNLFAFETYGLEPDIVVLGKGLGNGVPVAAAAGRSDVFARLDYGEASDTYSGNPLACAAVLATLHAYKSSDVLANVRQVSPTIEDGLLRLKELPFVRHVRGENRGMVWGVEMGDCGRKSAAEIANACVLACYRGEPGGDGIHLLGPLAKKVLRIAPPLVITENEAKDAMALMLRIFQRLAGELEVG